MSDGKKTTEDVLVKDGEFSLPRCRHTWILHARHVDDDDDSTASRDVRINPGDDEKMSWYADWRSFMERKVDDGFHNWLMEYIDQDKLKEEYVKFIQENDELYNAIQNNTIIVKTSGEVVQKGLGEDGEIVDRDSDKEVEEETEAVDPNSHRYPQVHEVGLINEDMQVNYNRLRGTMLAFVRDVEEIKGTEPAFNLPNVKEAWNRWMMNKFDNEWVRFITEQMNAEVIKEQTQNIYQNNDEFRELANEKYEYDPEELEGNTDRDETPTGIGGWAEQEGVTDDAGRPDNKRTTRGGLDNFESADSPDNGSSEKVDGEADPEDGDGSESQENDSTGKKRKGQGGLDAFAAEHGTTDDVGRPDHSSRDTDTDESNDSDGNDRSGETEESDTQSKGGINAYAEKFGSTTSDNFKKSRPTPVNKVIHGNSAKAMKELGGGYVDCCITSPPYWQLRDYEDVPDDEFGEDGWNGQLGHEPTPDMFVNHLADIFDDVKRLLKPTGALWINIADTYSGKSGGHYDADDYDGGSIGHDGNRPALGVDGVLPEKCLAGVPQRLMLELIDRGWILRNKVIWAKQVVFEDNDARGTTMPTAAKDRVVEKSAEPFYFFVKNKDYYFDLDSIRRPHKTQPGDGKHYSEDAKMRQTEKHGGASHDLSRNFDDKEFYSEGGANLPRVWQINTRKSDDEHYAGFPEELVHRPIKATCPEGGIVLDPFMGSGTVGKVARDMGRNYLGVEFSDKYIEIARNRIPDSSQATLSVN